MSTRRNASPKRAFPTMQRLVRAGLCLALALAGVGGLAAAPATGGPPAPGRLPGPGVASGPSGVPAITSEQAIAVALAGEVGGNDFRISHMGGDTLYEDSEPAVAYSSANHEYLVVWWGDDNTGGLVDGEYEIFG